MDGLTQARDDDGIIDFDYCVDTSDKGRNDALLALHQLFQRKLDEEMERKRSPLQDYHRHPNHHFHPPPTSHLLSINLHRSKMHLQTGINSLFRRCPRSRSPGHFLVKECFDGSQTMTKIIPKSNEIPLNQTGWPNCLPDHHSRKRIPQ